MSGLWNARSVKRDQSLGNPSISRFVPRLTVSPTFHVLPRMIIDLHPLPMLLVAGDELLMQRVFLVDVMPGGIVEDDGQADGVGIVHHVPRRHHRAAGPEVADGRDLAQV